MTSNYWHLSEKLLNYTLPSILLISAVLGFILFSIWLSHYQKKAGIMILILLLLNAIIFISVLSYTSDYRNLKPYTTYKNRDFDVSIYHIDSNSHRYINGYSEKDIENTLSLPFYAREEYVETEDWEYLGKDEHLYFLKKDNIIYNVDQNKELMSFEQNATNDVTIKVTYARLKDSLFVKEGFKELVGPYIKEIIIPQSKSEATYHPTNKTTKLVDY